MSTSRFWNTGTIVTCRLMAEAVTLSTIFIGNDSRLRFTAWLLCLIVQTLQDRFANARCLTCGLALSREHQHYRRQIPGPHE